MPGFPRPQASQIEPGGHRFPAAGEPPGVGRATPCDEDQRPVGQLGQQLAPQERVKRGHPLIGVEQHQQPLFVAGLAQDRLECARRGAELTAVDGDDGDAAIARVPRDLPEEGALADTTGSADMDDAGGRIVGVEALIEEGDLGGARRETGPVSVFEPGSQRPARRLVHHRPHPCSRRQRTSARTAGIADSRHGERTKQRPG